MKNTLSLKVLLCLIMLNWVSCKDDDQLKRCDPPLPDVTFYSDKKGKLTMVDSIPGRKLSTYKIFLFSKEITYLPLEICNSSEVSNLIKANEEVDVTFSGNVFNVPDNVFVYSIPIELTHIIKQKNQH